MCVLCMCMCMSVCVCMYGVCVSRMNETEGRKCVLLVKISSTSAQVGAGRTRRRLCGKIVIMSGCVLDESIVGIWEQLYADVIEVNRYESLDASDSGILQAGPEMRSRIINFLNADTLMKLWTEVASLQSVDSKYTTHLTRQLFRAHRTLVNIYHNDQEAIPSVLQHEKYMKLLSDSFVEVMDGRHALVALLPQLGVESRCSIALSLCYCDNAERRQHICSQVDAETALEMLQTLHRLPLKAGRPIGRILSEGHGGDPASAEAAYATIRLLLLTLLRDCVSATECSSHPLLRAMAHKLLLQQPSTCRMACLIVTCLAEVTLPANRDALLIVALLVSGLWATLAFVTRGDLCAQNYVTVALIRILQLLDRDDLICTPQGVEAGVDGGREGDRSLLAIVSTGVSVHLNSAERLTRINGMRVAVAMSRTLYTRTDDGDDDSGESRVHFDDLDAFSEDVYGNLVPVGEDANSAAPAPIQSSSSSDSDSDTDSDLESFYLDEVDGKRVGPSGPRQRDGADGRPSVEASRLEALAEEGIKVCSYLRECLAMLQFSDSTHPDGTYEKQKSALVSIPLIVASGPADARDNAAPLLKEILRLANSFNIEKFDELRGFALNSLVVAYPKHCVAILAWAVSSETLTLGCRVEVLAAMARAAYDMSGIRHSHAEVLALAQSSSRGEDEHEKGTADMPSTGSEEVMRGGKTTVKRPLRLAKMQRRTRYFRNSFGDCAEAFFSPVLQALLEALQSLAEELAQKGEDLFTIGSSHPSPALADPGLSVLLPAQALLALGAFVRCSVNTLCQRKLIEGLLPMAFRLRVVRHLHLRRAAVVALHDCLEALFYAQQQQQQRGGADRLLAAEYGFGTLEYAMNIGQSLTSAGSECSSAVACNAHVAEVVNWAMTAIKEEPDEQCRAFQYEIVKNAVQHLEAL